MRNAASERDCHGRVTIKWFKSSDVSLMRPRIHTMPASGTSTQRTQALALLKRRG